MIAGGSAGQQNQSVVVMQELSSQSYPIDLNAQLTERGRQFSIDRVEIYFDERLRETFLPNTTGIYVTTIKTGFKGQHTAWARVIDKDDQIYISNKIQFTTT